MISLEAMYQDYAHTPTSALQAKITTELSQSIGAGFASCRERLERCFERTEYFTNNCQKKGRKSDTDIITRQSGEPYFNHTLRVALLLIRERVMDVDVIIAAIMHDLFEDTTYTYADAKKEFGSVVADLIQCVTNVAESQKTLEMSEADAENIDYANIIQRCSSRRIAFYIKFADRLDNLATISTMPRDKQLKKISDTKKYLLPLMQKLGARRFESYMLDAIFRVESELEVNGKNEYMILRNQLDISNAYQSVGKALNALRHAFTAKKMANDVKIVYPTVYEISTQLKTAGYDIADFNQSRFFYDLFLIVGDGLPVPDIKTVSAAILKTEELSMFSIEKIGDNVLFLTDELENHFALRVSSPVEFNIQQYGSTESDIPIVDAFTIEDELYPDKILVFTADDEAINLPRGSTVTDFAFKLGDEIGLYMAAALVNNHPADNSTELHERDKVEIITTTDRNYTIKVSWLLHCKTVRAKNSLCRHLQSQIDLMIERLNNYE